MCVKIGKHLSPCICCIWHSQFTHVHRGDVVNAERISLFYRQALTLIRVSATPPTATPAAVSMYRKPSFFMHVFYKKVNLPDNHLPPDWDSHSEIDNPPLKTKKPIGRKPLGGQNRIPYGQKPQNFSLRRLSSITLIMSRRDSSLIVTVDCHKF